MMQVWWFHIERLRLPPGIANEYGKAIENQILSVDQVHYLATGSYVPVDALKEGAVSQMQSKVNDFDGEDENIELYGGVEKAVGSFCDSAVQAMDKYNEDRTAFGGGSSPSDIQFEFNVPIADTRLVGRMDIHASSSRTKDVKTRSLVKKRSKRRTQLQVDYDDQFAAYAYANSVISGQPNQVVEAVQIYRHPESATIEPLSTQKNEAAYDVLEDKAYRLHKILQSGSFYPVDPSSPNGWCCSARYCGAWKAGYNRTDGFEGCPFGERAQKSISVIPHKEGELK
jgi:hypothetical protein